MSRDESSRSAPAPDDPRKPASPQDLTKRSWSYTARKTMREFNRDQCTDLAAALTYYSVLAVAPAALALVSLLGVFGNGGAIVDKVMEAARGVAPGSSLDTIDQILTNLTSKQGTGIGVAIGLLIALWSASGYVNAFGRAMNRIYEVDEGRPLWKLRPTMLLVTLVVLVLVALICVALVLSGGVAEVVGKAIGLSTATVTVWNIAKWPVVLVLVIVIIAVLYYATPNVRQPKLRWVSVGSVVALLVWAVATALFGVYVARSSSYDATYGTLAGMIIFLLWVWLTNNALLFGAELDAELERARELQAGIAAERTIQLPPRDTEASVKKQTKLDDDIADGRALRESRGETVQAGRDGEQTGPDSEQTGRDGGHAGRDGDPASEADARRSSPAHTGGDEPPR